MKDLEVPSLGIQSIDYISAILELFCNHSGDLSLKEISDQLEENPAKILRYLVSLTRIGLLNKVQQNRYEIGDIALDLSFKALNRLDTVEEACKIAKKINYDTNYGVAVSVWGSMGPTVIKIYEAQETLYSKIQVGSVMSLVNTSIGNTFAQHIAAHILKKSLEHEALRHSGAKLNAKERNEFIQKIKSDNDQVIHFMLNRPIQGLSSISLPVFSISEEIQFVITVFHNSHVLNENKEEIIEYLLMQVGTLSKCIGLG